MNPIFVGDAAAALLLSSAGRNPAGHPTVVAELRSLLDAELLGVVDRWAGEGPDTEQLLCLADLLDRRAQDDPLFRERVGRTVLTGPEALTALDELAGRLGRAGHEHGRQWCVARAAELANSMQEY
jgi:hypothetical protein